MVVARGAGGYAESPKGRAAVAQKVRAGSVPSNQNARWSTLRES